MAKKQYKNKYDYNTDFEFCYSRVKEFLVSRCSIGPHQHYSAIDSIGEVYKEFTRFCTDDLNLSNPDVSIIMMARVFDSLEGIERKKTYGSNGYTGLILNNKDIGKYKYKMSVEICPFTNDLVDELFRVKKEKYEADAKERLAREAEEVKRLEREFKEHELETERKRQKEEARLKAERAKEEEAKKNALEKELRSKINEEYRKKYEEANTIRVFGFRGKQNAQSSAKGDVSGNTAVNRTEKCHHPRTDGECHHNMTFSGVFKAAGVVINGIRVITCTECGRQWELKDNDAVTRSGCTHRNADDSYSLVYKTSDPNYLRCGICGEEFGFRTVASKEDTVNKVNFVIDIIQTIKVLAPECAEVFKDNPLMIETLKSIPYLYDKAIKYHHETYGTPPEYNRL